MAEIFDLILFEGRSVKYAKLRVTENPYSDIDLTQWFPLQTEETESL